MLPKYFKQSNLILAKNQPQYLQLPVYANENGDCTSCWRLSLGERLRLLFTGRLWITTKTFNQPLQPIRPDVDCPFETWDGDGCTM